MADLRRWASLDAGRFSFRDPPPSPLEVTVRHRIVIPGPEGPVYTGEEFVSLYVDGQRVETDADG